MTERRKNTESAGHGRPTEPPTIKDGPRPSRSPLVIRVPPGLVERILTEGPGMCGGNVGPRGITSYWDSLGIDDRGKWL